MDMNNMDQGGYPEYRENQETETDAEKSQAGTNLVIVILVLVIVVAGVKLLMSSNSAQAPGETGAVATSTASSTTGAAVPSKEVTLTAEGTAKSATPTEATGIATAPIGKGEVAFSVLAKDAVAVRAIFVHNPARVSEGDAAWIQVYDGYKAVPAGQSTLVFTVSLAAMQYDKVKVRTLNVATGIPDETVKMMPVTVSAAEKSLVTIEL